MANKPKWRKGWKVLTVMSDGRYRSWAMLLDTIECGVIYSPKRVARPRKGAGPLAVFTSEKAAVALIFPRPNEIAIPCRYIPSRKRALWDLQHWRYPLRKLKEDFPGTTLADAVRILPDKKGDS